MSKHILVVDDEPDVCQIILTILRSKGYDVTGLTDGPSALEAARRSRPDMIICDLMMPGMSGMEFIKQVRLDTKIRATPIIALSALGTNSGKSEEFWRRGLNVDDFLGKPFDPLDLLGRVEFLFRRNAYVSTGGGNGSETSGLPQRLAINLAEASPKHVVRAFVEAWNVQDFITEFRCLAQEMTGGLSEQEYVGRRKQCFLDEKPSGRTQRISQFFEDTTSHNVSKVVCEREDSSNGRKRLRKETYVLRKGAEGWQIVSMRSVPSLPVPGQRPVTEGS